MARPMMNELGKTGLAHFSGVLYEEFLPQLQGQRGMRVYQEMSTYPVVAAELFAIEATLRSVPWTVEPATEKRKDVAVAEFVEECMHDMSHTWEDFISEVLSMLVYGWSFFEIVYKRRRGSEKIPPSRFSDGKIGWRKFAPRAQTTLYRWDIQPDGGIAGMWQYPIPTGIPEDRPQALVRIPIEKALLFRTTSSKNSPEGRSILRAAYRPWYFAKRIEEVEAIGIERDLAGMPVAEVPLEVIATPRSPEAEATYQYVRDVVTRVKRDEQEGIVWPLAYDENGKELYRFSLLSTGGRRQFDTGQVVDRYNRQIVMTSLADFILLGHEKVGSFALSSDKTELFAVALGAWLDSIEDVLNRHAVPRLLRLNGLPVDNPPQIRHGDIEKPDLTQLVQFVTGLANAGAPLFPDLVLENRLREIADLPTITEEERQEIMSRQAEMQAEMQAAMGGGQPGLAVGPDAATPPPQPGGGFGGPGGGGSSPPPPPPPGGNGFGQGFDRRQVVMKAIGRAFDD